MTGGIVFLLVAVALSVVGSLVLWLRSRQPSSLEYGIEAFSREMDALAPDRPPRTRRTSTPAADEPDGR